MLRGRNQIFLSAGERQSRELMLKAQRHCHALRIAAEHFRYTCFQGMQINQLEITLPNRVKIIGLPANPTTARGYTGDVFLDEFAMHENDREIWAAMFPTLLRGNGELDVASTPRGKGNMFHELRSNTSFARSTITLPDAIEAGLHVDIDELRSAMGDDTRFRQEFLCDFLDGSEAFLDFDRLCACIDRDLAPASSPDQIPCDTGLLFVGIDVGRVRDLTVIWVLQENDDRLISQAIIELRHETFARQFDVIKEVLSDSKLGRCCIDAGGLGMQLAEQTTEAFGRHRVEPVTFTSSTKTKVASALRAAVEMGRIRLPNIPVVIKDLHSVKRTMTASGQVRLAGGRNRDGHADRFWAAALAVHAANQDLGRIESRTARPLTFATNGAW
ncbi:MAG: phage terminase large subunit family protein [Planctomycetota bacterium]